MKTKDFFVGRWEMVELERRMWSDTVREDISGILEFKEMDPDLDSGDVIVHSGIFGQPASDYSYYPENSLLLLYYGPDGYPDRYEVDDIGNGECWLCFIEAGFDGVPYSEFRIKIRRITKLP